MNKTVITLDQLRECGACAEEGNRFFETFGEQVEVTPELLREVGMTWDISWTVHHGFFDKVPRAVLTDIEGERADMRDEEVKERTKAYYPHQCCPDCTFVKMRLIEIIIEKQFT
jgi:hypothetical protein